MRINMPIHRFALLLLAALLFGLPADTVAERRQDFAESERMPLYSFEDGQQGWTALDENTPCDIQDYDQADQGLRINFTSGTQQNGPPSATEIGAEVKLPAGKRDWHPFTHLSIPIRVVGDTDAAVRPVVSLKDGEGNYYQYVQQSPLPNERWTTLRVDITDESKDWEFQGHYKPWDGYCRQRVSELGIKVLAENEPATLAVDIGDIELISDSSESTAKNAIYNFRTSASEVDRYRKFEISFNLDRTYSNPFDPDVVRVEGVFIRPDQSEVRVPGFFYQDYVRTRMKGAEKLVPRGRSHWKIRFAPRQTGQYDYYVEVHDSSTGGSEPLRSNVGRFEAVEGDSDGFVRTSEDDPFHFELDEGQFYYPIGHNIASVHDARARPMQVDIPAEKGTFAYEEMLAAMAEAGENWGRIWMAPWSFGIEWTEAYSQYYCGRGRYNLYNAWRLDHVLKKAEQQDIRILLLLTPHGAIGDHESDFRGHDDDQRQGHPYWSRYGGPVDSPKELYTSEEARELYHKRLRYIVARWGYSTAIMGWEILNEADLASFYKNDRFGKIGAEFVRDAARHMRDLDPADHLITSSVFQYRQSWSEPLLSLDELDFNTGHIFTRKLEQKLRRDVREMQRKYNKIFLPTEAGLTPFAQDAETTALAIHRTLWSSFMVPGAGAAAPWWWVLIHEKDLYHHFDALTNFAEGEDRRGKEFKGGSGRSTDLSEEDRNLKNVILTSGEEAFGWIYDPGAFGNRAKWEGAPEGPAEFSIRGLKPGEYTVEVWDTYEGKIIKKMNADSEKGEDDDEKSSLTIELPEFSRDVAVKVKP
ncbi:MAG: DUF5060 domain-containing protein [Candidatus Brocadiia bacterium]